MGRRVPLEKHNMWPLPAVAGGQKSDTTLQWTNHCTWKVTVTVVEQMSMSRADKWTLTIVTGGQFGHLNST